MALPKSSLASFIVGVLILAYLSTFVIFAIIRVLWGVSIQRLWWTGLRHISFMAREGIRVDIRGLRLSLHRPTFAQPTWISIVVQELRVTVDLRSLGSKAPRRSRWSQWRNGSAAKHVSPPDTPVKPSFQSETETESDEPEEERSRTWERLTDIKEKIKKLHRQIQWIRLFDFVATNSSVVILDVGSIELASFTMAVDTRRKTVDRSRLFQHRRAQSDLQRPAEWIFTARGLLFSPQGKESSELLDHATLNVYGLLLPNIDGLRDASIALKLGRISLPYDDIYLCANRYKHCRQSYAQTRGHTPSHSFADIVEELDHPGSKDEAIVQTVSDSKEFFASILRGIQEVQFAVSYVGISMRIKSVERTSTQVYLNMSMKEVGLDLLRSDPKSPAHLTYFSAEDVAHQALLTAISISMGMDDGHEHPERLLYVPMATAMVRSTLPSKTIQFTGDRNATERNTNILYANLVITSPSIDFDPRHLPLMLAAFRNYSDHHHVPQRPRPNRQHLLSRLLPKASVKFSVHEPIIRVTLPCMDPVRRKAGEFDLLISAFSSMALDLESSHFPGGGLHYSLASNLRVTSHELYYQTASSEKHNLLITDNLELKVQISATPDVSVMVTGNAQTFSVYMVRPEISEGVRQIITQLRIEGSRRHPHHDEEEKPNFLRRMPGWLTHVHLQGSDFNVEVAGIDPSVSEKARGAALHLESWSAEYKANRHEGLTQPARRRAASRSIEGDEIFLKPASPSPSRKRRSGSNESDGRRLAIHTHGLEAFVVESAETWEPEPFMTLPRFEVAFSTSSDSQGAILHINSFTQQLLMQYSLYRHFAVGVAAMVLRKTFVPPSSTSKGPGSTSHLAPPPIHDGLGSTATVGQKKEVVSIDFRAAFIQLKATMPADPPLMIQIFGVEAGRHRWAAPFAKAQLARLYAEAPNIKKVWARVISLRTLRVDYRHQRRSHGSKTEEEKSFDVVADAIRIGIPHQLVVHKILDNVVNVKKTVEQLHHRFKTGTDEYILAKRPEGPKHVPKVTLRTQAFLFEIEDSSFEWKLGLIYLQGLNEQKQRLAREQAFDLKKKRIEEADARRNPIPRPRSTFQGRSKTGRRSSGDVRMKPRSKSSDELDRGRIQLPKGDGDRRLRYDADGMCGLSQTATRNIEDAREKLHIFNAQSWKKRINAAYNFQTHTMRDIRSIVWGLDDIPEEVEQPERILAIPQRPALMAVLISDLNITIDKPSFPLNEYPNYLHRIGKGMPKDTKYSLLIPMHVNIAMGEARITLRDYPLPTLHVPAIRPGQSSRNPSLSLSTDFVIAEEFRNDESIRHVQVTVVPPDRYANGERQGGFTVDVRRTVAAVKTYSEIGVEINTSSPTRITWGSSYQPAIQDMMQVVENFTKPAVDPSERVGFWDKIRLSFHSKVRVVWKGDGDVHLILKGSRDPYHVTGSGAGFVMCWRNDVRWGLCQDDDPRKFMTVDSGEYVLAIPDFSSYAKRSLDRELPESSSISSANTYEQGGKFRKTVMKLSGNVQWVAGLVFERNTSEGGRSFDFRPHYEVVLRSPEYARPGPNGEVWNPAWKALTSANINQPYDAYRGFRSQHIHLSVGISAPVDRDWSVTNLKPSNNYNSVHLTPRSFSHFFDWWSMFQGNMSLPIRQGPIWPGPDKSSKKFGRHLATIKYSLLFSPLYLGHIYKHKDPEEYGDNVVSATGIKLKLDSFMLDLHQRREVFRQQISGSRQSKTTGMRINQVQLDFISADVRAVSQTIKGTNSGDVEEATEETLASYEQAEAGPKADLSRFTIPDNDTDWVDMDDFVELDWILPTESNPDTKILPLAFAPRFTYFRQTDYHNVIDGDPMRSSPFGNEPTHFCVMSARNDPRRVQCDIIQERLDRLAEQIAKTKHTVRDIELQMIRNSENQPNLIKRLEAFQEHHDTLLKKQKFLQALHKVLISRIEDGITSAVPDVDESMEEFFEASEVYDPMDPTLQALDNAPLVDDLSDFNNRFILHNTQFKWNNSLRNIVLRYIHQVSQRRGFVYYMSRRAVKFILDIVEEQQKKMNTQRQSSYVSQGGDILSPQITKDDDIEVQDRIAQLINDGKRFVNADEAESPETQPPTADPASNEISREFTTQNAYHFRLVAPQIQLQSEKNKKAAVLVTAKSMQLKVIQIMDKDRITDDVSGLVQRRFNADMQSVQVFVTNSRTFSSEFLDMYSANRYGTKAGSAWPPWVPLEVMFDFSADPYGFSRVIQRTGATLRLDKFNTLRLKYNDDVTKGQASKSETAVNPEENRMDHLWVDFPKVLAICDSTQYYSLYIIVLDLLLYSEPLEKTRSERLEKIMLASDFSDLSGAPEMVVRLQEKIRTLQEIKVFFQINEKTLTRQQWKERIMLEQDLTACEDELFFIMKAITTTQRKPEDRVSSSEATPLLRWNIKSDSLVWHLVRTKEESLVELQLKGAVFDRIDNNDGSNDNTMQIGRIEGWNLLQNALYPQVISPYEDKESKESNSDGAVASKMIWVHWYMLEAIAGIPVMEKFEVNVYPLKIQVEHEVGIKVFDYIFPGMSPTTPGKNKEADTSPFMLKHALPSTQEEDEDDVDAIATGDSSPASVEANDQSQDRLTGAGDLSLRLQPTLTLPDNKRHLSRNKIFHSSSHNDLSRLKQFRESSKLTAWSRKDASSDHLRPESSRQSSNRSIINGKNDSESIKLFSLHRTNSDQSRSGKRRERSDDLTEMLGRASKYMTLAFVNIESMVLCLSYKGKGSRNIEDIHDLVFRMPRLEFRNKTWSNYDLFMQLKKEVVRALIGHAGAIVGNKFHRRANKAERSRLREMANSSIMLGPQREGLGIGSETTSMWEVESESEPRQSFTSGRPESEYSVPYSLHDNSSHSQTQLSGTPFSGTPVVSTPVLGTPSDSLRSGHSTPNSRPWTSGALTPALMSGSGTHLAGPGRPPSSYADSERADTIRSTLGRRLSSLSHHRRDGPNDDSEDRYVDLCSRAEVREADCSDSRGKRKLPLPRFFQRQGA